MGLIVSIGIRHAGEEILIGLSRQQIAVVQRVLAEIGEQGVARRISDDVEAAGMHSLGIGNGLGIGNVPGIGNGRLGGFRDNGTRHGLHQLGIHALGHALVKQAFIEGGLVGHGYCRGIPRLLCACWFGSGFRGRGGASGLFLNAIDAAITILAIILAHCPLIPAEFHLMSPEPMRESGPEARVF